MNASKKNAFFYFRKQKSQIIVCFFHQQMSKCDWKCIKEDKDMAQSQRDSLLSGSPAGRASIFFVWPGTDPRSAPDTIDHTVGETQGRTSGWGGVEEVWRLSLPWSPMALLTIQHPLNYPPIRSHRDKGPVLVCSRNMATNLTHSNITPTFPSSQTWT